jgi:hypothetical protein
MNLQNNPAIMIFITNAMEVLRRKLPGKFTLQSLVHLDGKLPFTFIKKYAPISLCNAFASEMAQAMDEPYHAFGRILENKGGRVAWIFSDNGLVEIICQCKIASHIRHGHFDCMPPSKIKASLPEEALILRIVFCAACWQGNFGWLRSHRQPKLFYEPSDAPLLFFNGRHQVTETRARHNMPRAVRVVLQFLPQAGNAHPENFLVGAIFGSPDTGQQFFRGHDLADVMSKLKQEAVFGG